VVGSRLAASLRCTSCIRHASKLGGIGRSLQVHVLLIDPDERELPDLETLVLRARHEDLLILIPLHGCDRLGVRLEYEDRALLLVVPHRDQAVLVACDNLTTWSLTPLQTTHVFLALKGDQGLDKSLLACSLQVKHVDCAILTSCNGMVLCRGDR